MPFELELDRRRRIVQSRARGKLTDDDLTRHLAHVAELFERALLDSTWSQIADFTEVESFEGLSSQGLRRAARCNPWPREAPRAFVVSSDLQYGLGRMYQLIGGPKTEQLTLVRSREEAEEFIARCGRGSRRAAKKD